MEINHCTCGCVDEIDGSECSGFAFHLSAYCIPCLKSCVDVPDFDFEGDIQDLIDPAPLDDMEFIGDELMIAPDA